MPLIDSRSTANEKEGNKIRKEKMICLIKLFFIIFKPYLILKAFG
jgi:hypothetical protein